MSHVSDPTLVFARHTRFQTHGCLCGWSDYGVTHAEHLLRALADAGFVLVDAAHLLDALRSLGLEPTGAPVTTPTRKPRLGGVSEVALECGVGKSTASMWMTRSRKLNFPTPYTVLASGNVYDLDEVKDWYRTYKLTRNGAHA